MKFRHTINVFIDNFSVTYKQLLYRLVISLISIGISFAVLYPLINRLVGSPDYVLLTEGVKNFITNLIDGNIGELGSYSEQVKKAIEALRNIIADNRTHIAWCVVAVVAVKLVERFFAGLGNYATASVINDKMALHSNSPFMVTLIKNLKEASLYNLIYVPLSFAYDLACVIALYFIIFKLFALVPFMYLFIKLFLFITCAVIAIGFKMTFTTDWLPSLIRGKMSQKCAIAHTFSRRRKNTFNVLSNFLVLIILIFAVNVCAIIFTFGVGALLTIPSSYVVLLCFEFVNYYDREEHKYFIDKNTIIKPEKERTLTKEEFFRGE